MFKKGNAKDKKLIACRIPIDLLTDMQDYCYMNKLTANEFILGLIADHIKEAKQLTPHMFVSSLKNNC